MLTLKPLADRIGTEVVGFDPMAPVDLGDRRRIVEAWLDRVVLVFRDQRPEPDVLMALAGVFGATRRQPLQRPEYQVAGFPDLRFLSNRHVDSLGDGKPLATGGTWHTDHSHQPDPPAGTMLQAVTLPPSGGTTSFTNQCAALGALDAGLRRRIEGRGARHEYLSRFSPRRLPAMSAEEVARAPSAVHPLIRRHPENGREALYFNPVRVDAIDGMDDAQMKETIAALTEHCTAPAFVYAHHWRPGDVIIWDNRQALHRVEHDYPAGSERTMRRTLVERSVA